MMASLGSKEIWNSEFILTMSQFFLKFRFLENCFDEKVSIDDYGVGCE